MAQHKAPTAVTIAAVEEQSAFAQWVGKTWKPALAGAVLLGGAVLFLQQKEETAQAEQLMSWSQLMLVAKEDPALQTLVGDPAQLLAVADQHSGKDAAPWAIYLAAVSALRSKDLDKAAAALDRLKQQYPGHVLLAQKLPSDGGTLPQSAVEQLQRRMDTENAWKTSHSYLYANPAPAEDAALVRFVTDKGTIGIRLYPNLAPLHVANFLARAKEGAYNKMKFHEVRAGQYIGCGDPLSIEGDPATWGSGGCARKLEPEESTLRHFRGSFVANKVPGDLQSCDTQVYFTLADLHDRDGKYVVFGQVVEGMEVVDIIGQSTLTSGTNRPETPTAIVSTEAP